MKEKGNRRCDFPRYTQQPEAKVVAHKVTSGRANSKQLKRDGTGKDFPERDSATKGM